MHKKLSLVAALAAPLLFAASQLAAGELRPDQKAAAERILAEMEPAMREAMRPQVEQSVAMLNEAQIAALMAEMQASGDDADAAYEEEPESEASPEDLAYNRAQYEPVFRKNWQAQREFDALVDAELAAECAGGERYAVFGSAYRYELRAPQPSWARAAESLDLALAITTDSYAPKDGRYDFDFSKVRMSFDRQAVSTAIAENCAAWANEAAAFQKKARALADAGDFAGADNLQRSGYATTEKLEKAIEDVLNAQTPGDSAFVMAMLNGKKLN